MTYSFSDRFKRTPQPDANLGPMPESSKSGVEVPSAAYEQMAAYWSVISAVRGGTSEIRDRGEAFLPLEPFEKDTAYLRRRNTSCLTPWYARLVRGLVGMVLRKPVKVEAGSKTTEHLDNINLLGDDLNTFAHEVFEAAIDHGYTGIFVDYPRSDGIQLLSEQIAAGLRPYWVHYTAPEIIGWRYEIQGNLRRFTQLRIREVVTEEDGEFSDRQVERIKVYDLLEGRCRWRIFTKVKEEFEQTDEGFLSLPYIPFVFIYTNKKKEVVVQPPMLEIAHLNIKHYQLSSDLDHSLHLAAQPKLVLYGYDPGEGDVVVGADEALVFENKEGRAEWLVCSVESFNAQQSRIDTIEGQMSALGLATIVGQKNVGESAEAKKLDRSQGDSIMAVIAQGLQDGFDLCLEYHAAYLGEEPGTCQVNRDFNLNALMAQDITAYSQLQQMGQISLETLLELLKKGEVLPDEFDIEAEIKKLEASDRLQDKVLNPDDREVPTDQPNGADPAADRRAVEDPGQGVTQGNDNR
ncbi:DUF4055 domain-containing protein [Trichocoleus desertorum AS-A10]|uniref:DUF4055 domain-containing protein n=1 Tax=Trichocoleus desertorum TaxID=1481672 RepID=UPI003296E95E